MCSGTRCEQPEERDRSSYEFHKVPSRATRDIEFPRNGEFRSVAGLDRQLVSSISQGRERCLIAGPTTCVAFSPISAALPPVPCWTAHSAGCHVAARSQGRETP